LAQKPHCRELLNNSALLCWVPDAEPVISLPRMGTCALAS
jgi:hypothetical protein